MAEKITPRSKDYPEWYQDVVKVADARREQRCARLHGHSAARFAIWEKMQRALDRMFKDTGHVNAYFPLFIPSSFLRRRPST